MKRVLTYIAIVAILAVGCSKKELPQSDMPSGYIPSDSPISFATEDNWGDESDDPSTKGAIITSNTLFSFSTFGYYFPSVNGEEAEWNNETIPNFMYNQEVERDQKQDGSFTEWDYFPKKYWSDNPNDRIAFFACAPYNCNGVWLSNNDVEGAPKFYVSPNNRPFNHRDFMTAEALIKSKDDSEVRFKFAHKLAQAKIYVAHNGVNTDSEADTVKILGITVKGMRKRGSLIYDEKTKRYVWEHQQPGADETYTTATYNFWAAHDVTNELNGEGVKYLESPTTKISDYTDPSLDKGQAYMFLVPQDDIQNIEFVLFFDYYSCKNDRRVQSFQKFNLSGSSLKEGQAKAYLLLVTPETTGYGKITTTVAPWSDKVICDKDDEGNDKDWVIE